MDLCTKFSDMISSVHFCSTFALQHPVSSAVEAKLWNCFVICIKELLPCKNTLVIVLFSLYFDAVPAISLNTCSATATTGAKKYKSQCLRGGREDFVKRRSWVCGWAGNT